jgi:hypothetical protein
LPLKRVCDSSRFAAAVFYARYTIHLWQKKHLFLRSQRIDAD